MALRPGVTITTQYRSAAESEAYPLAVYAKAAKTANGIQFIQSKAQAVAVFGEDTDQSPLTRLLFLCLEGGAGGVWAMCRTGETQSELETEFSAFLATQGEFLITDLSQQSQIQFMAQALEEGGMRKILFAAGDVPAEQINSMRCVLACPQVKWSQDSTVNLAAAAAADLVSQSSRITGGNGAGMEFSGWVEEKTEAQKEAQIELGNTDYRYFNLSTPLILDYIIGQLEDYLTPLCLGGATLDGIESLCAAKLMQLSEEGYLSAYGAPSAAAAEDDPSCCRLTVSFTPARHIVTIQASLLVQL